MKLLGSLFTLAVLGISTVFCAPTPDINQYDDTFHYWISDTNKKATIMGINNKVAKTATVKPYIIVEGERYYVYQIGAAAFTNSNLETLIINDKDAYANDQFVESINISHNALRGATKLKNIELNTDKVTADLYAFDGVSTNINFSGKGVPSLVNDYAKKLLESWGIDTGVDYTNASDTDVMKALHKLARAVKTNFGVNDKIAYPSNVAVVLALKTGSTNGIARAYRILARNMGFQYNDVHVGGDNGYYSWNYVYINKGNGKKWYNLDIINTSISSRYTSSIFKTNTQQKNVIENKYGGNTSYANPDNWVIYINEYNYPGENSYTISENFTNWLIRNRQGVRA